MSQISPGSFAHVQAPRQTWNLTKLGLLAPCKEGEVPRTTNTTKRKDRGAQDLGGPRRQGKCTGNRVFLNSEQSGAGCGWVGFGSEL